MNGYTPPSSQDSLFEESAVPPDPRQGICGTETEYLVLFIPEDRAPDHGSGPSPPFEVLERIIFDCLLANRKAAVSSGLKGGYFIENGGLIHFEIFLRTQEDTPILEAATPECRTPRDLLTYQRAFDEILTEISRASRAALLREGWAGRIAFGKNNRDSRGAGYGCHENYFVREEPRLRDKLLFLAAAPILTVLLVPAIVFLLLILGVVLIAAIGARAFPEMARWLRRLRERWMPNVRETLRAGYFIFMNALLLAPISLYSAILRLSAFRGFQRDLTAFLVTRQIFAGTGGLDFERGRFEIAQRPQLTTSLGEIVMFGRHKTIFDLKGLLYDPLALFRPQRKLTVTLGDSNLSDHPFLLKVGTASLVVEMVEAGVDFADLRLKRPVAAFGMISREGPWKELGMARTALGSRPAASDRLTAVAIQREYLRRAKEFFSGRPEGRTIEILELWDEALDRLADSPGRLAETLDWAAKKSILDRAILGAGWTWKNFLAWGGIFWRAEPDSLAQAESLEDLLDRARGIRGWLLRLRARRELNQGAIDPDRFEAARDLYYQTRKIDLRFHEISAEPGYQRQLESEGLLKRLTDDEEVSRATREPPPDTRARIRSYYIRLGLNPESVRANWEEVEIAGTARTIRLPDPFQFRIPPD